MGPGSPLWLLVAASLLLAVGFLLYCVSNRDRRGATPLSVLLAGVSLWLAGDLLQPVLAGPTRFGAGIVFLGADIVAVGGLSFALEYTGRERWLSRRTLGLLALKPLATTAVLLSPYWSALAAVSVPEGVAIGYTYELTRLFVAHALYDWTLVLAALALLGDTMLRAEHGYRRQVSVLLASFGVPFVLNVSFHLGSFAFDPTSIGFLAMSLGLTYATFQLRLLEAAPVARRTVLKEIDDAVLLLDEDDRVLMSNQAAKEAFGDGTEVFDATVNDLLDRPSDDLTDVEVDRDGEERYFTVNESGLDDFRGDSLGRLLVCRDVTERRAYEQELAEQNERLEQFASVVSHDLRNPLSVARGRLDLARASGEDRHFEAIVDAHERMDELITGLLTLARQGEVVDERVSVPLRSAAEQAFRTVDTGGVQLEFDDPPTVDGDPERLRQLLENLFRNAVEHGSTSSRPEADDAVEPCSTSPPSHAREDAGSEDASEPSVTDAPKDAVEHGSTEGESGADASTAGTTTIRVGGIEDGGFYAEDDGPGIPESERGAVFEYGYSTEEEGAGLGLSIVEAIAEAHGWTVSVTESAEGGARFEITAGSESAEVGTPGG